MKIVSKRFLAGLGIIVPLPVFQKSCKFLWLSSASEKGSKQSSAERPARLWETFWFKRNCCAPVRINCPLVLVLSTIVCRLNIQYSICQSVTCLA
ncbi:MAG: hypothetical protein ABIH69_01715 [bacterium]